MGCGLEVADEASALLFACLPGRAAPERAAAIRDAAVRVASWDRVLQLAGVHRLLPLLGHALLHTEGVRLPAAVTDALRRQSLTAGARAARLQAELVRLRHRLDDAGIDALPMRGPVLAAQLYADPALRQSDDLDLLLHRHDLERARDLLITDGYTAIASPAPPGAERHRIRAGGGYDLQPARGGYHVDLGWSLTPRYFAPPLTLADLAPFRIVAGADPAGRHGLASETLLVTLCVHGAKHLWSRHAWTADVAALLAGPRRVDTRAALAWADAHGFRRMVLLGMAWAARAGGGRVPPELAGELARDAEVGRLEAVLQARFTADPGWVPRDDAARAQFHLRARERRRDRVRYVVLRALTPSANDWRMLPLPRPLVPLYGLIRPLRLVGRQLGGRRRRPG